MDSAEAVNQPQQVPLVDAGNQMLSPVEARLDAGTVSTPAGVMAVITIRTASTTLTIMLGRNDLQTWLGVLNGLTGKMGGALVPASPGELSLLNGLKKRPPKM